MKLLEIVDIKTYDPSNLRDDQLRDDWRIVMAWYATLKDPEREIKHSEEEILDIAEKVLRELVARWKKDSVIITFKPEQMQPTSWELFEILRQQVEIPAEMLEALDPLTVTPTTVQTMTLEQLIELDKQLHEIWEAYEQGAKINKEDLVNAHLFVLTELKSRGHRHVDKDGLDSETKKMLESKPFHYDIAAAKKVVESLPDQIVLVGDFVEVVGDWLDPEKPTSELPTFDLNIKLAQSDPNISIKLQRICLKATNRYPKLGLLSDRTDAILSMGLYDLVLRKKGFDIKVVDEEGFKADYYESDSECESRVNQLFAGARDFVFVPDFVSLTGGFLYHRPDRKPNDLDIILRSYYRDPKMEAVLKDEIHKTCDLNPHWVYETRGPNWDYLPIYDLVLARKSKMEISETGYAKIGEKWRESRHRRDQCMECREIPTLECLWAEGHGRAWFCEKHFREWATNGDGRGEVISVKEIKDGKVGEGYAENRNKNIWEDLKSKWDIKESIIPKCPACESEKAEQVWGFLKNYSDWMCLGCGKLFTVDEESGETKLLEGMRPAFGSPGGKRLLAGQITSYIPDHKTYVEPFAGGAAVFFKKKPSEKEVLNDKDGDVAAAHRFIKQITSQDVTNLGKRLLTFSRKQFFKLRDSKPKSLFERFYRFMYISAFSFGQSRDSTVSSAEGVSNATLQHRLDRLERVRERLKNVAIYNADFRKVIKKYDSKETFFYFDPPYPEQQGHLKTDLTVEEIGNAIKSLKGQWILSLPNKPEARKLASQFHSKRLTVSRSFNQRPGHGQGRHTDSELLISNFPLKARKVWLAEAEKPSPRELERLELEKQLGDWYMVVQPKGKSFDSTVQQHVRGVWTDTERDEFLSRIRELRKKPDDKVLKKLWSDMDASALRVPFENLKKRAQKVADENGNVTAEIDRWTEDKAPSAKQFIEWFDKDVIVNRASTHIDLRITEPGGKYLIGWTGNTPGSTLQFLKGGKMMDVLRNKFTGYKTKDNILSQKKSVQPLVWLTLVTPSKSEYWAEPGQVGATTETAGLFRHLAQAEVVYGTQKTDYHEYFLFFKDPTLQKKLGGRWGWQLIGGSEEYKKAPAEQFWTANRPEEQRPYIMTHDFEKELAKAKSDKIDLVWNFDAVDTLEKKNYFKNAGMEAELSEWQETAEKPPKEQFWFRTKKPPEVKAKESEKIVCEKCKAILGIADSNNILTIKWGELKASFRKEGSTISCRHCGQETQLSP